MIGVKSMVYTNLLRYNLIVYICKMAVCFKITRRDRNDVFYTRVLVFEVVVDPERSLHLRTQDDVSMIHF